MRLLNFLVGILLLFCMSATESRGAWTFTNTTNQVSLSDNAAFTVPNADWTIGGHFQLSTTTSNHTGASRFFSWEDSCSECFLSTAKASGGSGTTLNIIQTYSSQNSFEFVIEPSHTFDTSSHTYMAVRSGGTVTLYVDGVSVGTDTSTFGWDVSSAWRFGNRQDGLRPLEGSLAEWAKWDRAFNAGEIAAFAKGYAPNCFPGFTWYVPMVRDYNELKVGIAVTNTSTTVSSHPKVFYCN